ncbi:arylsulfotransferase family protein [Aspergillus alliaceus]|uniref:arylsulfotransferase family protein n=1 Tax=Petromyces alliaceus TaxID=209559 RepID=UPI0012A42FA2|nr:ASST-domain-containing protein [Aspergillus alliaceus]KAB8235709.1 ASST-domain-containing protein [Aspergillus alliaceus]
MGYFSQFSLLLAATVGHPFSETGGRYLSRPDFTPPTLNITVPAPNANGSEYVFVAPYSDSIQQGGAYIYRKDGDLVWSGIGYYAGFVGNFHPTIYQGNTVLQAYQGTIDLTHGEGVGQHVLLDQSYKHVVTAKTGNHHIPSIHEFTVVNGESALVEIYVPTVANLTEYGGNSSQQWLGNGLFQEFDIRTGELVFEWNSLDHLDPANSWNPLGSSPGNSGLSTAQTWDYVHLNSVDKDDEGNYLISSRHFSTIYKINGTDGSIIWRLGGNHSTFTQDFTFGFQHDARWRSQSDNIEVISFFDNSGNDKTTINDVSRALIVQLNHTDSTASVVRKATAPCDLQARSQGNAQFLPNDRLFVGWGSAGAFTEFNADNEVLYHAFIQDAVSYRAFLANWTGTPTEAPVLATYVDSANTTTFYVSWNGDTETRVWRFYEIHAGALGDRTQYLGERNRKSFETRFAWDSGYRLNSSVRFYAEAVGSKGEVLARTPPSPAAEFIELKG